MRHDPRTLHGTACDLLVVGAGLVAAAIARDAALRGLSVVHCAAGDVVGEAGLRARDLLLPGLPELGGPGGSAARELAGERERLFRHAPHLVRPVPVLVPFHRGTGLQPWATRMGLTFGRWGAGRSTLPKPRTLAAAAAAAAFPGLRTHGLRAAVVFFAAVAQTARLTLANALAAAAAGARIVTHCRLAGASSRGVTLVDAVSSAEVTLRAHHVVNAAGTCLDEVRRQLGLGGGLLATFRRSSCLVLAPRAGELALLAGLPDGRLPSVVPTADGTLCAAEGTMVAPGRDELLAALGGVLDPAPTSADVWLSFPDVRAEPVPGGPLGAVGIVDERLPAGELHSVLAAPAGHRAFAAGAVTRWFGQSAPSPTRTLALPGGAGPREVTDPLWWRHGGRADLVRAIAAVDPAAARPLCPHRPFLIAEAVAALRYDGAATFADLLVRRLVHDLGPCLAPDCLHAAHAVFLRERRWPVDGDATAAAAALRAEVGGVTGRSPAARS